MVAIQNSNWDPPDFGSSKLALHCETETLNVMFYTIAYESRVA
jgi:hypothetical protein